jgi:hypothetical protein
MSMNLLAIAAQLSDDALLAKVKLLAERSRRGTVELIAHLAEMDVRRLHCAEGPGSLFRYCTEILRFSEAAAFNRIKAARAARKFPVILDLLTEGSVNLTTVRLLAPHLSAENHRALLVEATGMTRRQVDRLIARLAPQPDVPPSIRKLPTPTASIGAPEAAVVLTLEEPGEAAPPALRPNTGISTMEKKVIVTAVPPTPPPPVVAPLSPERYRVQFTMGKEAEQDLRCLQDLLRAEIPDGDPGEIVARALALLRREVERRKFAATSKPLPVRATNPGSRHIPADVQRKVWARDGGQCAFVGTNGHRCTQRSRLEFHHKDPYASGGQATVDNISLRCRTHNVYEARLIFGPYEPSVVRETPAVYGIGCNSRWARKPSSRATGPGTSSSSPW